MIVKKILSSGQSMSVEVRFRHNDNYTSHLEVTCFIISIIPLYVKTWANLFLIRTRLCLSTSPAITNGDMTAAPRLIKPSAAIAFAVTVITYCHVVCAFSHSPTTLSTYFLLFRRSDRRSPCFRSGLGLPSPFLGRPRRLGAGCVASLSSSGCCSIFSFFLRRRTFLP